MYVEVYDFTPETSHHESDAKYPVTLKLKGHSHGLSVYLT